MASSLFADLYFWIEELVFFLASRFLFAGSIGFTIQRRHFLNARTIMKQEGQRWQVKSHSFSLGSGKR